MPVPAADGKFIHCSYCNQRFLFGYEANKHERENHADLLQSSSM